ncbi:MAG: hypothetical protein M3506_05865 [Chloroflexota bacterium]|nr:hypothetical protein [Chloroflexota bacterium]
MTRADRVPAIALIAVTVAVLMATGTLLARYREPTVESPVGAVGGRAATPAVSAYPKGRGVCNGDPDGAQSSFQVDHSVPLTMEAVSEILPNVVIVRAEGAGAAFCAGNPPDIYTTQQLRMERVRANESNAPPDTRYVLRGGTVGKDTLEVGGGAPKALVPGQRYVLYAEPLPAAPTVLLVDVAMPIDDHGRVVEMLDGQTRAIPLADAVSKIKAAGMERARAIDIRNPVEPSCMPS